MKRIAVLRGSVALMLLTISLSGCGGWGSAPQYPERVLLIALDGFRWDYVDRAPAQRIRELANSGVRAERMVPVFPSKTFPNHYTIVTGLYPEHHGIVANAIYDEELGYFRTSDSAAQQNPRWWAGEPIWVTAEKQGKRAASYFWPGSETTINGVGASWWKRYDHNTPHADRINQIRDWLALPIDSGPSFIAAYFSDTDDAGHRFGPGAVETDSAIARVDRAVGAIIDVIADLGMTDRVTVILVADHGMADVSRERVIALDDYVDLSTVDVVDWNPVAAIRPREGVDPESVYAALHGVHPELHVFRKGEVPERYRFNWHPRITDIVAEASEGWTITSHAQIARWDETGWTHGGTHGYDPELISMGAVFIASGPGIAKGKLVPPFQNVHVYSLLAHLLGLQPAETDGSLDSVRAVLR